MSEPDTPVTESPLPRPPIKPLYDRLLVIRDKPEAQVGNIIIAEQAKEPPNTGLVVAVGEGHLCKESPFFFQDRMLCHVEPLRVQPGNRIIFQSYAGSELRVNGQDYLLLNEHDVLAVF